MEYETWLDTTSIPLVSAMRRWGGIEVRESELTYESLILQVLKPKEAFEPSRVSVAPCVELQKVDPFRAHSAQRPLHGPTHILEFDGARLRHPRRNELRFGTSWVACPETTGDYLGGSREVRHSKGREARFEIGSQSIGRSFGIERITVALHVGDLPQTGRYPRDGEPWR